MKDNVYKTFLKIHRVSLSRVQFYRIFLIEVFALFNHSKILKILRLLPEKVLI